MTDTILKTEGLVKRYGSHTALMGLDLELPRGKIIGLLGPNGSGKTTFLKLAAGLLTPSAGTVTVDGSRCCMYCREHSGKHVVLYAESNDFGASWSEMDLTDMPMIGSKPYAGTLSNGRKYLISSCAADIRARDPLTIALTGVGEDTFRAIY